MPFLRSPCLVSVLAGFIAAGTLAIGASAQCDSPKIRSHPASTTVCVGNPASFTVTATGTPPLLYQWQFNRVDIPGATSATFSLGAVQTTHVGIYTVIVRNACGSVNSAGATLGVSLTPAITNQPSGLTVCAGTPASFSVTATGTPPLTYRWRRNGIDISGATNASLTIAATTAADAGNYDCVVANACGSATSAPATLTVHLAPTITTQPSSLTVCAGAPASFTVTASGTSPLEYQWRKDGTNIAGATGNSLSLATTTASDSGNYDCVVTNECGLATSAPATLSVNAHVSIVSQPMSSSACLGSPASFTVVASGTAPLAYQWRKGGIDIPGATSATFTIASTQAVDAGSYDCVVTNTCNSVTSSPASLVVATPLSITSQPAGATLCAGAPMTFAVTAVGTPVRYQWRKNGVDIAGATSASLTIAATTTADTGNYDCVVANACNSLNSSIATLTVNGSPTITTQPSSHAVCAGATVALTVVATGTGNTYQWQKDFLPIPGATGPSYVIASARPADSGIYTVTVTNSCGRLTSQGAVVAVDANPRLTSSCLPTGPQPRRALAVDLDGVNGQDLVLITASGTVEVALNNGASAVVPLPPVMVGAGASGVTAADFDGDMKADIAVTNRVTGNVTVLYGNGAGGFTTRFVVTTAGDPIAVAATPVLTHTRADLVIADVTGRILVAHNDANTTPGARTFAAATVLATGGSFVDVAAGDVLGSTAAEIVAIDGSRSVAQVFDAVTLAEITGSPFSCALAPTDVSVDDVNGDGKAEVIVGGATGVTVLQTPALTQNTVYMAPAASIAAGNFDGDRKGDLCVLAASGQVLTLYGYNDNAPPDRVEAGSCLLTGSHVAPAKISRIGLVANPLLNTDEIFVVRGSLDLVCVLRYRLQHSVQSIAGSGCPSYLDTGSTIGLPVLGNAGFTLTLQGAYASTFTMILVQVNAPAGSPPVLFPIGPCQHVIDLQQYYFAGAATTNSNGQAFLPMGVPNLTHLAGVELRAQWLTVDPAGAWNGSVTFSTATLFRIGEY